MIFLRSLVFQIGMYVLMLGVGIVFMPWMIFSSKGAVVGARSYGKMIRWMLEHIVGLKTEVRGPVPQDEVLIASKHQSFLDILILISVLPRPKFIMKKELVYAPIVGQFALRLGCIPVDRGKGRQAVRKMMDEVAAGRSDAGQLVIYPQGTRVAPGAKLKYKAGVAALYQEMDRPCHPVAANVGLFWPRHGFLRKPGLAVMEFLDPIAPGLPNDVFMAELETRIETASDRLMADAGFKG